MLLVPRHTAIIQVLPKVEGTIGKPLSPYAVTKYVNELYADVFYKTYGLETIGLRYFNVFGRKPKTLTALMQQLYQSLSSALNERRTSRRLLMATV